MAANMTNYKVDKEKVLYAQDLRTEPNSRHFPRIFGGVVRLRRQKPQENNEEVGQSRFASQAWPD